MSKSPKSIEFPEPPASDELSADDIASQTKMLESPERFSIRQEGLTVPKPSYYEHIDKVVAESQPEHCARDVEAFEERYSADPLAREKRERSRRMRYWIYLILIVLIYVGLRTVNNMH